MAGALHVAVSGAGSCARALRLALRRPRLWLLLLVSLLSVTPSLLAQTAPARRRIELGQIPELQGLLAPFERDAGQPAAFARALNPAPTAPREADWSALFASSTSTRQESARPLPAAEPSFAMEGPMPPEMVFDELVDPFDEDAQLLAPPQKLSSFRNSFFQKLSLQATYIGDGRDTQDLGFTELETYLTVAVPFPIVEWPLLITPYYQMRLLAGPQNTDLPPRLYDAYVDFMWVPQIVNRWLLILSVAPGVYTDFQKWNDNAFRVTGKALVRYDFIPDRVQLIGGLLYLGRANLPVLPAAGVIWTPTDDYRFELIFPKPKLAARFNVGAGFEDWIYLTAEFGGNTYAITRENGEEDRVTWQDYRLLLGIERKLNGGAGFHVEGGYVFGRRVDFVSDRGDFTADNTWLIRGGVIF